MVRKHPTHFGKRLRKAGLRKAIGSLTFKLAAGLLLVATIAVGLWRTFDHQTSTARGLAELASAYRNARPTEARISGFSYAPRMVRRGGGEKVEYAARDLAERLLLDAVSEKPGSASSHALGKSYLAQGSLEKAVDQFQKALDQDVNNSQLHSDLGVALFEMSEVAASGNGKAPTLELLAQSLEQVSKALELDPGNLEALYNRALLLPYMKVPDLGKAAWQEYLARETHPQWIAEAKHNLQLLIDSTTTPETPAELLDSFLSASEAHDDQRAWEVLSRNREMITGKYIPQELARAFLKDASAAQSDRFLKAMTYAGRLELAMGGDPFVLEMADYYSRATASQRAILIRAHDSQVAGYASSINAENKKALSFFLEARDLFAGADDEREAKICEYWIAYCVSQQDKLSKSSTILTALTDYCEEKHYNWLFAQATSWLANNLTEQGEHSESLKTYLRSLSAAEATNDTYLKQKIFSQVGNVHNLMVQPQRALEYDWRSLQLSDRRFTSARQMWRNYLYTTRALATLRLYNAATAYANAMLAVARDDIGKPDTIHFSYLYLAQIYGGERKFDQALHFASESLRLSQSLSDQAAARKLSAGSLRMIAHLQRQSGKSAEALNTYDQALQLYAQMESSLYSYDANKGKLLCYVALGDSQNFEAVLPIVMDQFEDYRAKIREEQNRNTFFDNEQSVYDLAIDHASRKGADLDALNYSEKSRARSLLASLTNSETPDSLTLDDIKAKVPSNVQLVEFSVLPDRVVIWVITKDSINAVSKNVSSAYLQGRISEYLRVIEAGPNRDQDLSSSSRELYDLTIAPVFRFLDPQKVLCLIPDKALSYLPFATIISPSSGNYLINDFSLLTSPSLNVFFHCTEAARRKVDKDEENLLSVGNPSFDPNEYPELKNLPAAADEAEQIAANYSSGRVYKLVGPAALKGPIKKFLPEANVIHFAGHYLIDEHNPLLSRLVLAKRQGADATDSSDLMGSDLVGLRLPRAKVVVFSACQTSGEDYYNGEGLLGISRMFLEAGSPLVVASQWAVETKSTAELMLKFHRYRKAPGVSSIAALRQAQLEMLSDQSGVYRDPYYWAAFIPVGGYTDF